MIELSTPVQIQNQFRDTRLDNIDLKSIKEDETLKKVSEDFESFFAQQIMDISLKTTNVAGEGLGSDIIKGMYTETMSKNTNGTLGISDMIYKFLSENNR